MYCFYVSYRRIPDLGKSFENLRRGILNSSVYVSFFACTDYNTKGEIIANVDKTFNTIILFS